MRREAKKGGEGECWGLGNTWLLGLELFFLLYGLQCCAQVAQGFGVLLVKFAGEAEGGVAAE